MTAIQLTPAQHAILAHAIEHTGGRVEWFPDHIKGGARQKVLEGLFKKALITHDRAGWCVAAEGFEALGLPRPGVKRPEAASFEASLDQIIANAEQAAAASDPELEAAVTAAEARWAQEKQDAAQRLIKIGVEGKPRIRAASKISRIVAALESGATIPDLVELTGWQEHALRAALCHTLPRKGIRVIAERQDGMRRKVYRLAEA